MTKNYKGELFNDFIFGMNAELGVKADYLFSINNLATLDNTKVRDNTFLISAFIDLSLK